MTTIQPQETQVTPYTESHKIVLTKPAQKALNIKAMTNNARNLVGSVNQRNLVVRGWSLEEDVPEGRKANWRQKYAGYGADAEYIYEMYFVLNFNRADGQKPQSHELNSLLRTISDKAPQAQFGRWMLSEVDGEPFKIESNEGETHIVTDDLGYARVEIPADWDSNFDHLYGLDDQIEMVKCALEAGIISGWEHRFNAVLQGPPGCGKSDICRSIKRALGEDAVLEFDATATTAAGAIKELSEREILPRVILVEEIEKADEKALSFLLSVLDLRGEIRKTTARNTIVRDTKLFGIATVNNIELFNKLQAGALASRFSNEVNFERPSREQLEMILKREVKKINGDEAWIKPTLDYADEKGITDPRRVTAICLCGRDKLVTGEYQRMLTRTGRKTEGA